MRKITTKMYTSETNANGKQSFSKKAFRDARKIFL